MFTSITEACLPCLLPRNMHLLSSYRAYQRNTTSSSSLFFSPEAPSHSSSPSLSLPSEINSSCHVPAVPVVCQPGIMKTLSLSSTPFLIVTWTNDLRCASETGRVSLERSFQLECLLLPSLCLSSAGLGRVGVERHSFTN